MSGTIYLYRYLSNKKLEILVITIQRVQAGSSQLVRDQLFSYLTKHCIMTR